MGQERLNQAQFAKRMGYSRQYVNRLIKAGKITLGDDKKLDFEQARAQMVTNADPARAAFSKLAVTPADEAITQDMPEQVAPADPASPTYQDARTQREIANAQIADMQLKELQGQLVNRDQVRDQVFTLFRNLQERVLHLPNRVAGKLATMKEERLVAACLDEELNQLFSEAAQSPWLNQSHESGQQS